MPLAAKQKKQGFITQSSKFPSPYPTGDSLLKDMSYNPCLVSMGLEEDEEDFCFDATKSNEDEGAAGDEDY